MKYLPFLLLFIACGQSKQQTDAASDYEKEKRRNDSLHQEYSKVTQQAMNSDDSAVTARYYDLQVITEESDKELKRLRHTKGN